MKNTKEQMEREVRIVANGNGWLEELTIQELSFLIYVHEDLFSGDTVKDLEEQELKINGVARGHLLDMLEVLYIDDRTKENREKRKIAKSLYDKINLASKEEVYHIRKTLIESENFLRTFRLSELSW